MPSVRSNSGLVNVYDSGAYSSPEDALQPTNPPSPVKTLSHLTTSISTLRFNHDSQILAVASKEKKGSMRLVSRFSTVIIGSCL
jgi:U3 small nucleolar RNA-associated protein 18